MSRIWYLFYYPSYRKKLDNMRKIGSKSDKKIKNYSIEKINLKNARRNREIKK